MTKRKSASERIDEVRKSLIEDYTREKAEEFESTLIDCTSDDASPIEQLMAMALSYLVASELWHAGEGRKNNLYHGHPPSPIEAHFSWTVRHAGIEIYSEVPVGKYRCDFLVRYAHWRGGVIFGAIECDGHDHHDLTKDQAKHDRERDRYFQSIGLTVLRYPGSEIWRSPLKAAADALGILENLAAADAANRWRTDK